MILDNVEFHNIAETKVLWNGAHQLQRIPEAVRVQLNEGAQLQSFSAANAEIRFVCDGDTARVTLAAATNTAFRVAFGEFLSPIVFPVGGSPLTLEIAIPENLREIDPEFLAGQSFDPRVFRILLPSTTVSYFSVVGENVRPPAPEHVPAVRYLAYGTSITQGGCATSPHLSYVSQAARRIGADVINLGMGGSCHAEKAMADYIASRNDWDIATLELSVNMTGVFDVDEFRRRVEYTVNAVGAPGRPVICIPLFPYFVGMSRNHAAEVSKAEAFRQTLRDVVAASGKANVTLVEGDAILDGVSGLSADMIHPSDFGMMRMGENIAAQLRRALERYSK